MYTFVFYCECLDSFSPLHWCVLPPHWFCHQFIVLSLIAIAIPSILIAISLSFVISLVFIHISLMFNASCSMCIAIPKFLLLFHSLSLSFHWFSSTFRCFFCSYFIDSVLIRLVFQGGYLDREASGSKNHRLFLIVFHRFSLQFLRAVRNMESGTEAPGRKNRNFS